VEPIIIIGDGIGSVSVKKRANMVESTDMEVGWRALYVGNVVIQIEMFVKRYTK